MLKPHKHANQLISLDQIIPDSDRPELHEHSGSNMWNDNHISRQMLAAHLNSEFEGASRKHDVIKKSVNWICTQIHPNSSILDLGCGPGLYTTLFCKKGHQITGIDFSETSINYAINSAERENLKTEYRCQNYLEIEYENCFDLITLIYCDFGVLSLQNQSILLRKIFKALKQNGKLIFDVLSYDHFKNYQESTKWNHHTAGFWRPHEHLELKKRIKYATDRVTLEEYQIIDKNGVEVFRNWNTCYQEQEIINLLSQFGFCKFENFADLTGREKKHAENVIGILAQKGTSP